MKRILPLIKALFLALFFSSLLNGCAIFGEPTGLDDTKGWQANRIYEAGALKMEESNYDEALRYFQILESRFPHGVYATQAQLEIIYAYYLKGLATFNERGMFERLTQQQINDRDPKALKLSFAALKELVERYPNSRYFNDATLRMVYIVNTLAQHEMHVARYYMNRQAYLAALNRAKYVIEYYPKSTAVEEALMTMVSAYDYMELTDLKEDSLRVLKKNFPENPLITGKVVEEERVWWKFWDIL